MANVPISNLTTTWNNVSTTFTGIKLNVTDTASAAASLLIDLQKGGTSQFSVSKSGELALLNTGATRIQGQYGSGFYTTGEWRIGTAQWLGRDSVIQWDSSGVPTSNSTDLVVRRDAAAVLAQRNGVNAQTFRLYNTFTDVSNYERGFMRWNTNVLEIGAEAAGTGTGRALSISAPGGVTVNVLTTGSGNSLNAGGNLSVTGQINFANGFASLTGGSGTTGTTLLQQSSVTGPILFQPASGSSLVEQRNGTNAQTNRLYGTYTDASNYRRLTKTMSTAGVAEIKPEGAGTGASGNVLHISGLPTSNPGPGILWNNSGVVNVGT
jgi:hypothetical protein